MILVTGATGTVGQALIAELAARDAGRVRAMVRKPADLHSLPDGVQAAQADFTDPTSLRRALDGVQAAYLVCAAVPQLVELETRFLLACKEAKTPNVVLQSALGAGDFPKSFPSWHRQVEDKARELGIAASVLRPNGFMQNLAAFVAPTVRSQDAFYDALGQAAISYIDVRDIAAAAAGLLTSTERSGKTFELNGPEALTHADLAGRISKVARRPIRYVELTPEQMLQGMLAAGMPQANARPVVELFEYYRAGKAGGSDRTLRELIARPPRTIDAYLAENVGLFTRSSSNSQQDPS